MTIQVTSILNVSNLRDTGQSTESTPAAASAEEAPVGRTVLTGRLPTEAICRAPLIFGRSRRIAVVQVLAIPWILDFSRLY